MKCSVKFYNKNNVNSWIKYLKHWVQIPISCVALDTSLHIQEDCKNQVRNVKVNSVN